MVTLKTAEDVQSYGEENLAYHIYEGELDVGSLESHVLRAIINGLKPIRNELNEEYLSGDPLCYPPDWYDSYVFPLDSAISLCQDEIDERDEDSEW